MQINLVKDFGIDPMPELKKFYFDRHIQNKMIADWLKAYPVEVGRMLSENKIPNKYKNQMDNLQFEIINWEQKHGKIFNSGMISKPPTLKKTSPPTPKHKQV
jgi:hypothetical protein